MYICIVTTKFSVTKVTSIDFLAECGEITYGKFLGLRHDVFALLVRYV